MEHINTNVGRQMNHRNLVGSTKTGKFQHDLDIRATKIPYIIESALGSRYPVSKRFHVPSGLPIVVVVVVVVVFNTRYLT